jgi:hypothetical protein
VVENRHSVNKTLKIVCEMILEKWSNKVFALETEKLHNLHLGFVTDEIIFYTMIKNMATAILENFQSEFATVVVELIKIIGHLERSGQDNGSVDRKDVYKFTIKR